MQILREPDVLRKTGLSRSTLMRLRKKDDFPKPIKISTQCIGWSSDSVEAWLSKREAA